MMRIKPIHSLAIGVLILLSLSNHVFGAEKDETLELLEGWSQDSATSSRAPKPLSQTAENITIITSTEIEAINAHTLSDVLATVPGLQLESIRTPGSPDFLRIQGSSFNHVLVLLDNVAFNNLGDNFSDIGQIPAHIIERVEIVKGAASSAWGQALGGVINVITKSPDSDAKIGGLLSSSYGKRTTSDTHGEIAGQINRFGYFLSGGYLASEGLLPNNQSHFSNAYAKLSYELPNRGQISGTFVNFQGKRGDLALTSIDLKEDSIPKNLLATLNFKQPLANQVEIDVSGNYSSKKSNINVSFLSDGTSLQSLTSRESTLGVNTKLIWRTSQNLLVFGGDYDHVRLKQNDAILQVDTLDRRADRWGFFLNDTLTLGKFAISPGLRYDIIGTGSDQFSPSFGVTYQLTDNTLVRGYTGRGYSLPSLFLDLTSEKVWTSQFGVESSAVPYLWLKGTLFRNETWDISVVDPETGLRISQRQLKQGFELEGKTTPVFNTSITAGYSFVDAKKQGTDEILKDVPRQTVHLGLRYDDQKYLKVNLNGRHIWWNAASNHNGSYRGLVWDLFLNTTPFSGDFKGLELFFSVRNLFNGSQYLDEAFKNTGRWAEGGLRFRF